MVARNMTINCDRWTQIAFSSEYYRSGQKILVRKGSKATSLADLDGQKVCAPKGTSRMDNLIKLAARGDRRSAPTTTPAAWCCSSRARSTRSPATTPCWPGWPPRTRTRWCRSRRPSPPSRTGWASTPTNVDFVRFVNAVLAEMRSDGEWTAIYNRWLAEPLGPAPARPRRSTAGTREHRRRREVRAEPDRRAGQHGTGRPGPDGRRGRPDQAAGLPRPARAAGATTGGPSWTSSTRPRCSRRTAPPPPATSPCRWRCGRRCPTATSSCWRSGTPAGSGPTERMRLATLIWGRLDAADRLRPVGLAARGLPALRRPGRPAAGPARAWRSPAPRSPTGSGSCGPRWNGSGTRSTSSRPATAQQQAAEPAVPAGPPAQGDRRQGRPRRRRGRAARPAGDRRRHASSAT